MEKTSDVLDQSRDTYLVRQGKTIDEALNSQNWQRANDLLFSLTHKSEKRRGPLYLKKFNEYWRDQKDEYKKKIPLS